LAKALLFVNFRPLSKDSGNLLKQNINRNQNNVRRAIRLERKRPACKAFEKR
jgi:hypothetical protein